VISGDGPCNAQRIAQRRRAHEEGAWVREAAVTHAAKHGSDHGFPRSGRLPTSERANSLETLAGSGSRA
jgi:hypothetical protein